RATRDKVERLVREYAQTIEPSGKIFKPNLKYQPSYAYDKTVIGLIDAWRYAEIDAALPTLARATDAAVPHLPGKAQDSLSPQGGAHESYTLSENQFIAWQAGAGARHLQMAQQYLYDSFFEPLAAGQN